MDRKWFEDIMRQTFNEDICFNPSKLIILYYFSENLLIKNEFTIVEIQEYLYRVYIDNPDISAKHPNYIVRNISKYGVADLNNHVMDSLQSWENDAPNGIIKHNNNRVWLLSNDNDVATDTKKLCKMLMSKVFKTDIPVPVEMAEIIEKEGSILMNTGIFRNRVFEDMQYCPVCEEILVDRLVGVHIVNREMGATDEELCDKNNGLILCKKHATDFIARKFYFDDLGFIQQNEECEIEPGMHLSFAIRNTKRKRYLKRRSSIYGQ